MHGEHTIQHDHEHRGYTARTGLPTRYPPPFVDSNGTLIEECQYLHITYYRRRVPLLSVSTWRRSYVSTRVHGGRCLGHLVSYLINFTHHSTSLVIIFKNVGRWLWGCKVNITSSQEAPQVLYTFSASGVLSLWVKATEGPRCQSTSVWPHRSIP